MRVSRSLLVVAAIALAACSSDDDDSSADAEAEGDPVAELGCAGTVDGEETCEFTAPEETEGLELWVWFVGEGSVRDEGQASTGGCGATGGGVCLNVGSVAPRDDIRCVATGSGQFGCSIQPGGPAPPAEVIDHNDKADECREAVARHQEEERQRQEEFQAELDAYNQAVSDRGPGDPLPQRPFPPVPSPPPGC